MSKCLILDDPIKPDTPSPNKAHVKECFDKTFRSRLSKCDVPGSIIMSSVHDHDETCQLSKDFPANAWPHLVLPMTKAK